MCDSTPQYNNNNNIARVQRKSLCRPTDLYIYVYYYCTGPFDIIIIILTDYRFSPQPTHVPSVCPNSVGGLCLYIYIYNLLYLQCVSTRPGIGPFYCIIFVVDGRWKPFCLACKDVYLFTLQYNIICYIYISMWMWPYAENC